MRLATLSTWRGYSLWTCALCKDTALSPERMRRHLTGKHNVTADRVDVPEAPAENAADAAPEGDAEIEIHKTNEGLPPAKTGQRRTKAGDDGSPDDRTQKPDSPAEE